MRRAPRSVVAAALVTGAALVGAALTGCGAPEQSPAVVVTPPAPVASQPPVAVPGPTPRGSLAPPVAVPEPPVPTAHYRPVGPPASSAPSSTPSGSPSTSPTPSVDPTISPAPTPVPLVALLLRADGLAPPAWSDSTGVERTAPWSEAAPPSAIAPAASLPHLAAARSAGGACAAAAADGQAIDAASVTLTAEAMPGSPVDLVLVRYPTAAAAATAVAALQAVGVACDGVETAEGTLRAGTPLLSATAVLESEGVVLVIDAISAGELLIAVLHEGAPAEVVTALAAAQRATLT